MPPHRGETCDTDHHIFAAVVALADSGVHIGGGPWVRTAHCEAVLLDMIEMVKGAFDAWGISIPHSQ